MNSSVMVLWSPCSWTMEKVFEELQATESKVKINKWRKKTP